MKKAHKQLSFQFIIGLVIVLISGIIAILPFLGKGFIPTHDGEFHFIRFAEFFRMLQSGYIIPRWAPTINSGYGLPVFEFLYPFVNYISSLLHIVGIGFVDGFKISSVLGYVLAILFCFLWLTKRFGVFPAVIGTIASSYVPYWFVELYIRGTIGEVWAIVFMFLAFLSIEKRWPIIFAIALSGIILSHNILTLIVGPLVIVYLVFRADLKWITYVLLGFGLAAFFWIPALMESRYMIGLNTVNFKDHFASIAELLIPSWGTGFSGPGYIANKMSFQIGIGPILWLLFGVVLLVVRKISGKEKKELMGVFLILFLVLGMTLPISTRVWELFPLIQFVQHPWRYLVYLIPITAYIAALVSASLKNKWIGIIFAILSISFSFSYTRGAIYEPRNDAYYLTNPNFTDSASSMGNSLTTIWTPWKDKRSISPVTDVNNNPITFVVEQDTYLDKTYKVSLSEPTMVRIHVLYFPGWMAFVDGVKTSIDYNTNGTLDISVPKGNHIIHVQMYETVVRKAADWISIISLVITLGLGILLYVKRKKI